MSGKRDCERIRGMLSDYVSGSVPSHTGVWIRQHVDACEGCANELQALRRTAELLDQCTPDQAPDMWESIRSQLAPRERQAGVERIGWWLSRHWIHSAVATVTATAAILGLLLTPRPHEADVEALAATHASMSWREPFADRAGLGLATAMGADVEWEEPR